MPKIFDRLEDVTEQPIRTFDLVPQTVEGFLDDLIPGSDLMNKFMAEFENMPSVWVYYPRKKDLVRFTSPSWHRLALIIRNSFLLRDPNLEKSWEEIRDIFKKTVVAVAGCSVGNSVAHGIMRDLRPDSIKIADKKNYHLTNGNRVHLSYEDFGRNKAIVTAEQIHALDPFVKISVFPSGIYGDSLSDFVDNSTVVIEETDSPKAKIAIRKKAREKKVPVIMVSDIGSAIQLDVRRFDINPDMPLTSCSTSDDKLFTASEEFDSNPNRQNFYKFFESVVGEHYKKAVEFKKIIHREDPPIFGGVPQLGSTVMVGGGIVAEMVARLVLGHKLPERLFFQKHTGEIIHEGRWL